MNYSMHSADRTPHLKIVVVALAAGIAMAAFGISARPALNVAQTVHVIKAGQPTMLSSSTTSIVR